MSEINLTISETEQGMSVSGKLVFSTAVTLSHKTDKFIEEYQATDFVINCKNIEKLDSAGIALMIAWQRKCISSNIKCLFHELPQQAKSLLSAYHLDHLISA